MLKKFTTLLIAQALIALIAVAPVHAQFSPPSGGGGGTFTGPFPGNPIDPVLSTAAPADNTSVATTGTIVNGANALTVASAATWSVNQGIAIASSATSGTTELIGCVSNIAGNVFTIVVCGTSTPLNASCAGGTCTGSRAVNHDNVYALNQAITLAIATQRPIQLQGGTYNITSHIFNATAAASFTFRGAGRFFTTTISNRSLTDDTFLIQGPATMSDFAIVQAGGATGGYGMNLTPLSSACATNMIIQNIFMLNVYQGMTVGQGVNSSLISNIQINDPVSNSMYYNNSTPCGDNLIEQFTASSLSPGGNFVIYATDTMTIRNLKLCCGPWVIFTHESQQLRFVNPSLENQGFAANPCGFDFGAGVSNQVLTITGGEIAGYVSAFCNTSSVLGGGVSNVIGYTNGTSCTAGLCGGDNGILNYMWPAPVVSGCSSITQPTGSSDLLNGIIAATCTAQALTITFNTGSNRVPNNGLLCTVRNLTHPLTLFDQVSYAVVNMGTMTSSASATFASVTTTGSDTLKYQCQPF